MTVLALLALVPLVAPSPHGGGYIPPTGPSPVPPMTPPIEVRPGSVTVTTGGGPAGPTTPGSGGPSGPTAGPSADSPTTGAAGRGPGAYAGPGGAVRTGAGRSPAGPVAGPSAGPAGPVSASAPVASQPGSFSMEDAVNWDHWWHHNRDAFLDLRRAVHTSSPLTGRDDWFLGHGETFDDSISLRPTEEQIRGTVVPALLAALRDERSNDVLTGALVALAKIGDGAHQPRSGGLADTFLPFLMDSSQEVSETAALALGILGNPAGVEPLVRLLRDDERGSALVGRGEVPVRTRAFAAYGLGLIGAHTEMDAVREWTARALVDAIVEGKTEASDEIEAAAVIALGLARLDFRPSEVPSRSNSMAYREDQVRFLLELFGDERRTRTRVRAHAPRSLVRLVEGAPESLRREVVQALMGPLAVRSSEPREVRQACALALGALGRADDADREVRSTLERAVQNGDELTSRFALIALARVAARPGLDGSTAGYAEVRKRMLKWLASSGRGQSMLRPWAALALGQLERTRAERGELPHSDVVQALRDALEETRRPYEAGAYCLALGLVRDPSGSEAVFETFERFADDETRGYAAVALGLMGEWKAAEKLRETVRGARYRPSLLSQSATGLALLGDKDIVPELISLLGDARGLSSQASLASALGRIGDKRSIDPLVEMLKDREKTSLARGFAAVALGIVAEKELLPWNAKIAADVHYAAGTVTLTDPTGAGVLDIL